MSQPWQIAVVALAALTTVLAVVVLGILRRTISALEKLDARERLQDQTSAAEELASYAMVGHHLSEESVETWPVQFPCTAVFLESGCLACRQLAADVSRKRRSLAKAGQSLLFVVDGDSREFSSLPDDVSVIHDQEHRLFSAWQVDSSPIAYCVMPDRLVIAGNHPNTLSDVLDLQRRVQAMIRDSANVAN